MTIAKSTLYICTYIRPQNLIIIVSHPPMLKTLVWEQLTKNHSNVPTIMAALSH